MIAKELSRKEDKIVITTVEFIFEIDRVKYKEVFDIPHFNPKDEKDIQQGIENRYVSEERDLIEKLKNKEI